VPKDIILVVISRSTIAAVIVLLYFVIPVLRITKFQMHAWYINSQSSIAALRPHRGWPALGKSQNILKMLLLASCLPWKTETAETKQYRIMTVQKAVK